MVDPLEGIQNKSGANGESELKIQVDRLAALLELSSSRAEASKNKIPEKEKSKDEGDNVRFTNGASILANSSLDRSNSTVKRSGDSLDFNLKFSTSHFGYLTTKGSYAVSEQRFDLFMNFNFEEDVNQVEGAPADNRTFNVRLKFSANKVSPEMFSKLEGNSDRVEQAIDNMMSKMLERAYEKKYPPTSVVLNVADIADLVSTSGGIFQRVSSAMMLLNSTLARAVDETTSGGGGEPIKIAKVEAPDSPDTIDLEDFSFQITDVTPAVSPSIGTSKGHTPPSIPAVGPSTGGGSGAPSPAPAVGPSSGPSTPSVGGGSGGPEISVGGN